MTPCYYDDGTVRLYHGDCREIVPALGEQDQIITDAPYDLKTHAGARTNRTTRGGVLLIDFDPLTDVAGTAAFLVAFTRRWVVAFCAMEMLGAYRDGAGEAWVRSGFWRRPDGTPQVSGDRPAQPGEGIAIMHRPLSAGREGRTRWNRGGHHAYWETGIVRGADTLRRRERVHETQKPEALMCKLVADFTDAGETVLDPFMGSGSTLVAAKRLGRRGIGIDVDEACCEMAAHRLEQGVLDIFEMADA